MLSTWSAITPVSATMPMIRTFATAGVDNPPLHALQSAVSGVNDVYPYRAGTFPNQGLTLPTAEWTWYATQPM
jgi:hypothetical protein